MGFRTRFAAHITQFVEVGWNYLTMERGVGDLVGNGTYVALTSPDRKNLTIVIQNMVGKVHFKQGAKLVVQPYATFC